MSERVELSTVLAAIRARRWTAVFAVAVVVAVGYAVTAWMPRVYSATTTVLVGQTTEQANLNREDILASQNLAMTYADLSRREPVLGQVVEQLGLDTTWLELRDRVLVTLAPGNNQLVVVTAHASSPQEATQTARAITEELIRLSPQRSEEDPNADFVRTQLERLQVETERKQAELADVVTRQATVTDEAASSALQNRADTLVRQISNLQGNYTQLRGLVPSGRGPNALQVLEPAMAAAEPVRPDLTMNLAISGLLGILVAAGLCYYMESRGPRRARHALHPSSPFAGGPRPGVLPGQAGAGHTDNYAMQAPSMATAEKER